jgi:hypothetical protein
MRIDFGLYSQQGAYILWMGMWNVYNRFSASQLEALPRAGFAVGSTRGVMRAEKYGCAAEFRRADGGPGVNPDGEAIYELTILPSILVNGQFARLWDAGYQKFLLTDDGHKTPARAEQLMNLRKCNEELRTALGVPTYYNEALGSTSAVSEYDRVKGRQGDVPDPTGEQATVKSSPKH